jgi:hypothetical protein
MNHKSVKTPEETAEEFGLTYAPFRNYHTKRVKKLRGSGFIDKFKFLYQHNGEFRINVDLMAGLLFALIAAVSIVTILIRVFTSK